MGTVDLHRIEAAGFRVAGALGEGTDHVIDVLWRHDVAIDLAGHVHARGRVPVDVALGGRPGAAHATAVPELRRDPAALGVHGLGDLRQPARRSSPQKYGTSG
jgi:hypothetical protein